MSAERTHTVTLLIPVTFKIRAHEEIEAEREAFKQYDEGEPITLMPHKQQPYFIRVQARGFDTNFYKPMVPSNA